MELLEKHLKHDEGKRLKVYRDSRGNLTCGWGHLIEVGDPIPEELCERWFKDDVAQAITDFAKLGEIWGHVLHKNLNATRRRVIVEMLFNMNLKKVLGFKKMLGACVHKDWEDAADNILWNNKASGEKTPLYTQVKGRAERWAQRMVTGED